MKWMECGRKNKVAVCLSLLWRRSQQSGTESNRPERKGGEHRKRRREDAAVLDTVHHNKINEKQPDFRLCGLYLFV